MNRLTKDIEKYWELEQQIGCPLGVVFKALKEGICVEDIELGIHDEFSRPRLYFSDDFKCFRLECCYGSHYEYLSNYQKTWWLASDKKEKPNDN